MKHRMKDQLEKQEEMFEAEREKLKRGQQNQVDHREKVRTMESEDFHRKLKQLQEDHLNEIKSIKLDFERRIDNLRNGRSEDCSDI